MEPRDISNGLLLAGAFLFICGCGKGPESKAEGTDRVLAEAFGVTLSETEVLRELDAALSRKDSLEAADRVMDRWIAEQIMVEAATQALPLADQNFDKELATYRRALLLHRYEDAYVQQRIERTVDEDEARVFYEDQPHLFPLTDYVVRARFLHLPEGDDGDLEQVRELLASSDTADYTPLEQWCINHGAVHSLDPDAWWYLDQLLREIPMQIYRADRQLADRRLMEFTQEGRRHLLVILEHALKDDPAPFALVKPRIEALVLHGRRQALLLELEEKLVTAAWANGKVKKQQ
jgi:hypothetical protein